MAATRAAGSVIVKVSVSVHPLASETVTVYVPAVRLDAVAEDPPPLDQAYVYAVVPPEAEAVASPSFPPLQFTLSSTEAAATSAVGSVIVTESVSVQPFASVAVTVYIPADSPVIEDPEPLLLQEKEYPEVPPDAEAEAAPVLPPLQLTFVPVAVTARTVGCVIVVDAVPVHPLLSVTVTV